MSLTMYNVYPMYTTDHCESTEMHTWSTVDSEVANVVYSDVILSI